MTETNPAPGEQPESAPGTADAIAAQLGGHVIPSVRAVATRFAWAHLTGMLAEVSRPFAEQAVRLANGPQCPETTRALWALWEAKNYAVIAYVPA
jgi:hypothetical protein